MKVLQKNVSGAVKTNVQEKRGTGAAQTKLPKQTQRKDTKGIRNSERTERNSSTEKDSSGRKRTPLPVKAQKCKASTTHRLKLDESKGDKSKNRVRQRRLLNGDENTQERPKGRDQQQWRQHVEEDQVQKHTQSKEQNKSKHGKQRNANRQQQQQHGDGDNENSPHQQKKLLTLHGTSMIERRKQNAAAGKRWQDMAKRRQHLRQSET